MKAKRLISCYKKHSLILSILATRAERERQWVGYLISITQQNACALSRLVMSNSLQLHGKHSPWDSPGKNTGIGCHFLPQGIFLTQGSNPNLLHWQVDSLPLYHLGSLLNRIEKTSSEEIQLFLMLSSF